MSAHPQGEERERAEQVADDFYTVAPNYRTKERLVALIEKALRASRGDAPTLSGNASGRIWLAMRRALVMGEAIARSYEKRGYEELQAALDAEARERGDELEKVLADALTPKDG